ncbi:MAG TPA: TonB-dependent receptor, partial [Bacteroidia bacterium]|nr:TonB-dependent receptor [Bacteroidia bacterium]
TFTYAQDLGPINGVEIFRGPQPTRAGRNVYGGLINVTTRRPGDTLEGSLGYEYGSFGRHGVDAWVMSPLGESASFRFGGGYDTHEGYLTNPLTGKKVDHQESYHFGGALYLDVAPGWEVGIIAGYAEQNDGAPRLTSLDRTTGFYTVGSDVLGEQHRESNYQAIRIAHENDRFKFLSVTSHRGFDLNPYTIDLDFTPLPFGFTTLSQTQELWSQEFRFSDNDPDADWGWNAGVYGSTSRIEGRGLRGLSIPDRQFMNTVTPIPAGAPPFLLPFASEIHSATQLDTLASLQQLTTHTIDEDSFAIYGGLENRTVEDVTFRAGARLDWIQRSIVRDKSQTGQATTVATTTSVLQPGSIPLPDNVQTIITSLTGAQPRMKMQDEWVHVTPTFGVDWQAAEDHLIYANTTYAFKPGGFSAYADDPAFVPFDEETAWTSEVGVRSNWLGGRAKTNLVAFYSRVDDYQVERSFTPTDFTVFNADEAEIYGAEFETTVEITPTLDFLGSIGWTHARLTDYVDPVTGRDLSGATAPFVPEFDAVAALDYHLENGFFARLEMVALGNVKFDDFNRPDYQQKAYVLLNSAVGYRKDKWSVALYGRNLADKEYYTNMNPEIRTGAVGIPREYGVRVGVEF